MFEQQILGFPIAEKHKYSALWTVAELVDVCFVSSSSHPHCFVFLLILLLLRSVLVWVTPALLQLSMIRICLSGYCWQIGSDTLLATPQGAHATTAARQGRHNIINNRWQQWMGLRRPHMMHNNVCSGVRNWPLAAIRAEMPPIGRATRAFPTPPHACQKPIKLTFIITITKPLATMIVMPNGAINIASWVARTAKKVRRGPTERKFPNTQSNKQEQSNNAEFNACLIHNQEIESIEK